MSTRSSAGHTARTPVAGRTERLHRAADSVSDTTAPRVSYMSTVPARLRYQYGVFYMEKKRENTSRGSAKCMRVRPHGWREASTLHGVLETYRRLATPWAG